MVQEVIDDEEDLLILASEVGLWAEELQAPWDAITAAGHELTLATHRGLKPLPLKISMDPTFVDPFQNYLVNPPEVVERTEEILAGHAWDRPHPRTEERPHGSTDDAIVIVGGPGAALDLDGQSQRPRPARRRARPVPAS